MAWHGFASVCTSPWCNILNHLNYFAPKTYRKDITRNAKTESKMAKRKLNPVAWHGSAPAPLTSAKSSILRSHLNRLIIIVATFLQTSCFLLLNSSFNPRSTLTFAYFLTLPTKPTNLMKHCSSLNAVITCHSRVKCDIVCDYLMPNSIALSHQKIFICFRRCRCHCHCRWLLLFVHLDKTNCAS